MHGTRSTFGKPFVRKQYNGLVFLIASAMEVPIELSEDCYCDLSVPIPNGYTKGQKFSGRIVRYMLHKTYWSKVHYILKDIKLEDNMSISCSKEH